jgi:hypothetical protein
MFLVTGEDCIGECASKGSVYSLPREVLRECVTHELAIGSGLLDKDLADLVYKIQRLSKELLNS